MSDLLPGDSYPADQVALLDGKNISDLSEIAKQTHLKVLELDLNPIKDGDITCLATLTQLEGLYLNSCRVTDISVINHMPMLEVLEVNMNRLKSKPDFKSNLNLQILRMRYSPFVDVMNTDQEVDEYKVELQKLFPNCIIHINGFKRS